ncbi:MAG TPA: hypothetical protein EYQ66_10030 [Myxococcales bacterium]|nr:hypothetical protein [Myxococcales bacterium]
MSIFQGNRVAQDAQDDWSWLGCGLGFGVGLGLGFGVGFGVDLRLGLDLGLDLGLGVSQNDGAGSQWARRKNQGRRQHDDKIQR